MEENNDEEIRNVLNELINNEDETTQKILDKKKINKKRTKKIKSVKKMEINPIITNVKLYIGTILLSLICKKIVYNVEWRNYRNSSEYSVYVDGYPSYLDEHHIMVGLAICAIGNMFIMIRAIAKIIENIIVCSGKKGQRKWYIFLIILLLVEIAINIITILWTFAYYEKKIGIYHS